MPAYVVIPARGGSKGVPAKNLRTVGGIPLIARSVTAARAAARVDRVFVSTDDPEIARVANDAGAEVIERPPALSTDEASSDAAVLHALDVLAGRGEHDPDIVVLMQCTSPFTTAEIIDGTIALLEHDADCAFTGARSHFFLWRMEDSSAVPVNHDAGRRLRRQDLPPEYFDTGAVYAMRTEGFRRTGHRFFGRIAVFEVSNDQGLEIDSETDLAIADVLLARPTSPPNSVRALPAAVAGIAFDFDGVLTDNRVLTFGDGAEAVCSDRSDGLGIERLRAAGVPMVVLSKERHPVVTARCQKLGLECMQAIDDKVWAFKGWVEQRGLDLEAVVFVGNDLNDVECLRLAGCGVVVADAHPSALAAADVVLSRRGGSGAVRELADLLLDRRTG